MLLLDTSIVVSLIDRHDGIMARFASSSEHWAISSITRVELEGGVERERDLAALRRRHLDYMLGQFAEIAFGPAEAAAYGQIVARMGYSRRKVIDRMIAATALSRDLPLTTLNERNFRDVPGLRLIDWSR